VEIHTGHQRRFNETNYPFYRLVVANNMSQINLHLPKERSKEIAKAYRVISSHAVGQGIAIGEYIARILLREAKRIEKRDGK